LLLVALVPAPEPPALLAAGGGTFEGVTGHADAREAEPVRRWSHLAVTYDGTTVSLFVDGDEVSRRATTGRMLATARPLWIGGNHPYGEYFQGLIDEVRVYDRALSGDQVRAEMTTAIARATGPTARGLVGAWSFDRGSGRKAADASTDDNAGALIGPTWTPHGRFGRALRFDGSEALVRVPASPSLELTDAMTLSAWIRPAREQNGWRTVVHRQTDAYFLMAGGAQGAPPASDDARAVIVVVAAICLCLALVAGRAGWLEASGTWWPPVALFIAGSVVDASLTGRGTVLGSLLVAIWFAFTARRRAVAVGMSAVAVLLAAVTLAAVADPSSYALARDDGGVARSAALGLVLLAGGLLAAAAPARRAPIEGSTPLSGR
jgi:Concanavalin A-like lectin/glucanases superfamily